MLPVVHVGLPAAPLPNSCAFEVVESLVKVTLRAARLRLNVSGLTLPRKDEARLKGALIAQALDGGELTELTQRVVTFMNECHTKHQTFSPGLWLWWRLDDFAGGVVSWNRLWDWVFDAQRRAWFHREVEALVASKSQIQIWTEEARPVAKFHREYMMASHALRAQRKPVPGFDVWLDEQALEGREELHTVVYAAQRAQRDLKFEWATYKQTTYDPAPWVAPQYLKRLKTFKVRFGGLSD